MLFQVYPLAAIKLIITEGLHCCCKLNHFTTEHRCNCRSVGGKNGNEFAPKEKVICHKINSMCHVCPRRAELKIFDVSEPQDLSLKLEQKVNMASALK